MSVQIQQSEMGNAQPVKKGRIPYGTGRDAEITHLTVELVNKLKSWGRLFPPEMQALSLETIQAKVHEILPPGMTVPKYAKELLKDLRRKGQLPVELWLFMREPRVREFDYQVVYAIKFHLLPRIGQRTGMTSKRFSLGRKGLPKDFAEFCGILFNLNGEQKAWVLEWSREWDSSPKHNEYWVPDLKKLLEGPHERLVPLRPPDAPTEDPFLDFFVEPIDGALRELAPDFERDGFCSPDAFDPWFY